MVRRRKQRGRWLRRASSRCATGAARGKSPPPSADGQQGQVLRGRVRSATRVRADATDTTANAFATQELASYQSLGRIRTTLLSWRTQTESNPTSTLYSPHTIAVLRGKVPRTAPLTG